MFLFHLKLLIFKPSLTVLAIKVIFFTRVLIFGFKFNKDNVLNLFLFDKENLTLNLYYAVNR